MYLDARTAQSSQKINAGKLFAKGQTQRLQTLVEGRNGVVADAGYASFAQVDGGQRFQNIIELAGGEVNGKLLVTANVRGMLEISHAVFVEDHARTPESASEFDVDGCDSSAAGCLSANAVKENKMAMIVARMDFRIDTSRSRRERSSG